MNDFSRVEFVLTVVLKQEFINLAVRVYSRWWMMRSNGSDDWVSRWDKQWIRTG
jgi:hypothetical protein